MMTAYRLSPLLKSCWKSDVKFIHSSSVFFKKQYDFDLNSLIEWKKETNLAFGSPRKPTKTGKLKKSRTKLDGQVLENLETLSLLSSSQLTSYEDVGKPSRTVYSNKGKQNQRRNIPLKPSSAHLVPPHKVPATTSNSHQEEIYDSGNTETFVNNAELATPDAAISSMKVYASASRDYDNAFSDESSYKADTRRVKSSEDEIHIPELSPVPSQSGNKGKRRIEAKEKVLTDDDIVIPKIAPVPPGNTFQITATSFSQQSVSAQMSVSSKKSNLTAQLPLEAPDSFEIIPKIPIFPREDPTWQSGLDTEGMAAFKMDIEEMSFRVPPSVKTILNKTMSDLNRYFLNRWREGLIKELGEEGFKLQQEATIKKGVNLHANIMEYLSGKPVSQMQIMPDNEGHWASLQSALASVSDIAALELEIHHSLLFYRGVFDCIARYKDLFCLIDWKTSKKPRPLLKNTYDDPLQAAAYIGALNSNDSYIKKYGQINHGMIVVAYPDGSPAHIHMMNKSLCEQYWHEWTDRLHNFYQLMYTEKAGAKKLDASTSRVVS